MIIREQLNNYNYMVLIFQKRFAVCKPFFVAPLLLADFNTIIVCIPN